MKPLLRTAILCKKDLQTFVEDSLLEKIFNFFTTKLFSRALKSQSRFHQGKALKMYSFVYKNKLKTVVVHDKDFTYQPRRNQNLPKISQLFDCVQRAWCFRGGNLKPIGINNFSKLFR